MSSGIAKKALEELPHDLFLRKNLSQEGVGVSKLGGIIKIKIYSINPGKKNLFGDIEQYNYIIMQCGLNDSEDQETDTVPYDICFDEDKGTFFIQVRFENISYYIDLLS